MKNLTKIFMAFVALMLVSCIADTTTEPTVELGKVKTTIDLSFEGVKTHLGDKVEVEEGKFQYPLLWSAGDQIAVNGIASEPLAEEFDGKAGASFEIESNGELGYPRSIIYPAPAEGTGVTFPAVQAYEAGNIADGVAPLYGYAAEAGDVITLQHLTGVLRFAVKGDATLASMTVKAESGAIAGSYDIDCATGALTAQDGKTSDQITMSFGDGLALSTEEATPIYITIPAGEYGAIITRLVATDGKTMVVKFPSQIKAIAAGKVREFAEFTFVENSVEAEDDGVFEIHTYEDLKRFTKIAATFYPRTEAKLMEDIAIPAEETWTPIEGFNHTFNGNGKSISGLTAPLFGTTAAKIKDLSLTNVAIVSTDETMVGSFARYILDGGLTGCSASGSITYTKSAKIIGKVGGLVASMKGCEFTNNTNNIAISATISTEEGWSSTTSEFFIGGLVAELHNPTTKIMATNNHGTITVAGILTRVIAGGVFGICETNISLEDTHNHGEIYANTNITVDKWGAIGGVIGAAEKTADVAEPEFTLTNCSNKGAVTFGAKGEEPYGGHVGNQYIAGLIGYPATPSKLSLTGCYNTGALKVNTVQHTTLYYSGLIGSALSTTEMTNCYNSGNISLYGAGLNPNVAGLIAYIKAADKVISLTGCYNEGEIYVDKAYAASKTTRFSGIITYAVDPGTEIALTNVENRGELKLYARGGTDAYMMYAGSLVAYAEEIKLSMSNCKNTKPLAYHISKDSAKSYIYAGGLIGYTSAVHGTMSKLVNEGDISASGLAAVTFYGGLIGCYGPNQNEYTTLTLSECENKGNLTYEHKESGNTPYMSIGGILASGRKAGDATGVSVIADKCKNSGKISVKNTTVKDNLAVGGIFSNNHYSDAFLSTGYTLSNCENSGAIELENTANVNENTIVVGGVLDSTNGAESTITNCTNTSTGTITIDKITYKSEIGIGGFAGMLNAKTTLTSCSNKAAVSVLGTTNTDITGIGGFVGQVNEGASTLTSCNNSGAVTFNVGTSHTGTIGVGGFIGYNKKVLAISSCWNSGAVICDANKATIGAPCVGGFMGYTTAYCALSECYNTGTITCKPGSYNSIYLGGIIGYTSKDATATTTGCMDGCYNKGAITLEDGVASSGNIRMGGVGGYIRGSVDKNLANYGDIYVGATSKTQILLGGVIGYNSLHFGAQKGFVNTGNITITGGTGTSTNAFAVAAGGVIGVYYNQVEDAVNTGNITFTGTANATKSTFGGILAHSQGKGEIKNCQSYCDIYAKGMANVGIITGSMRLADGGKTASYYAKVRSCQLGGKIATTESEKKTWDDDTEDYIESVSPDWNSISNDNYFSYIYGGTTNWTGVEGYDGCSWLSAAPSVTVPAE